MTVKQIGQRLVALCREGKFKEAVEELYSQDVVSVEAVGDATMPAESQGIDAVRAKGEWWEANHEVHGCEVAGPFPNHGRFAVIFRMDITSKIGPMAGQRMQFQEVAVYTVANNKIVREEFYYDMGE